MKTLTKCALAAAILASTCSAKTEWVSGYPRSSGAYVQPYYRTPANGVPYDNLSYRGYPSQRPGYPLPPSYGLDSSSSRPAPLPSYSSRNLDTRPSPYTGDCSPTPQFGRSRSSGLGF
jgi:hypothetical protein